MSEYYDQQRRQTKAWQLYEIGKQYNNSLVPNQYTLVNTNIEFFAGNQWKGLAHSPAMASLPKPVFNIIKRVAALFVASLTSSATKVSFEPLANKEDGPHSDDAEADTAAMMASSEVENLFEKFKMDFKIREAMFDGVQTGDYCAHFYWDPNKKPYGGAYGAYRGEICMELVDGINVMFGNPNTHIVDDQPYILIIGRDTVENLRAEYLQHHPGDTEGAEQIMSDKDYNYQAASGGRTELTDSKETSKALFVYFYTRKCKEVKLTNPDGTPRMEPVLDKDGNPVQRKHKGAPMFDLYGQPIYEEKQMTETVTTVYVSKHTRWVDIFDAVDTGLNYYPIAWGNWERQKNQYHGRALVTEIIPNQIYINSMFALIMRHQQMLGFPKTLYDGNVIGNWTSAVGQAIPVYDLPPDRRLSDLHSVIQPADMSTQIMQCIERAFQYTKECLGATDAQMGNVRPDNTSALIALQSSSQVPLENPQACKYEWIEDIGRILLDMMGTYYGERPVARTVESQQPMMDPSTGRPSEMVSKQKVIEMYDFRKLKDLWLNVRADVGASTYWSRIAIVQTLDNLKQSGVLDVIDYLERMPDEYIPRKDELIAKLRKQISDQQAARAAAPVEGDAEGLAPMAPAEPAQGVAFGADAKNNDAAIIASMPQNMQQLYDSMGTRTKKALLQQTKLNTVGV